MRFRDGIAKIVYDDKTLKVKPTMKMIVFLLPPPLGRPISGGVVKEGGFVCGDIIVIIIVKNGIIEQVWLQIYVKRELFYDNQQQC